MIQNQRRVGLFSIVAVMIIRHLFCQQAFGSVLDSAQTSQLPPSSYEVKIVESSELDYASHAVHALPNPINSTRCAISHRHARLFSKLYLQRNVA